MKRLLVGALALALGCRDASPTDDGVVLTVGIEAPAALPLAVQVYGPGELRERLSATTTLSGLPAGMYRVETAAVRVSTPLGDSVYTPDVPLREHTLAAGEERAVELRFVPDARNPRVWFGGRLAGADLSSRLSGVDVASLLAGGVQRPEVQLAEAAGFNEVADLARDAQGNLWVADCGLSQVLRFAPEQLSAGGPLQPSGYIDLLAFPCPNGLAFDAQGALWVSSRDANALLRYGPEQLGLARLAEPSRVLRPRDGSVLAPGALGFAPDASLWVAAVGNGHVARFAPEQLAQSGRPLPSRTLRNPRGSPGKLTGLLFVSGELWLSGSSGVVEEAPAGSSAVVKYSAAQLEAGGALEPQTVLGFERTCLLRTLGRLSLGSSGRILVAVQASPRYCPEGVAEINPRQPPAALEVTTSASSPGPAVVELQDALLTGGPEAGQLARHSTDGRVELLNSRRGTLAQAHGLAFDRRGALWVSGREAVGRIAPEDLAAPHLFAPSQLLRHPLLRCESLPTTPCPLGITFDAQDNLWVASPAGALLRFPAAVLAAPGEASPDVIVGADVNGSLRGAYGLAFAPNGDLWVTTVTRRVMRFDAAQLTASGAPTPALTFALFPERGGTGLAVSVDAAGTLYLASWADSTLHRFTAAQLTTAPSAELLASPFLQLPNEHLWGTALDARGGLWVSANASVLHYGAEALAAGTGSAFTRHAVPVGLEGPLVLSPQL